MKKITCITSLLVLFNACSLDYTSEDSISGENVINTVSRAKEVLNTAYSDFPKDKTFLSLYTEDFVPTWYISQGKQEPVEKMYYWDRLVIKNNAENLWQQYYKSMFEINTVLAALDNNISDKNSDEAKKLKGRALGLKASIYYELLLLFSDRYSNINIPGAVLKDKTVYEDKERSGYKETLAEINKLCDTALSLLPKDEGSAGKKEYFGYYAVKLLKAKTALLEGSYQNAINQATELITQSGASLTMSNQASYQQIWNSTSSSPEVIMYFSYNQQPYKNLNYSYEKGDYVRLHSRFTFEENDVRSKISDISIPEIPGTFIGKYRLNIRDSKNKDIVQYRFSAVYFLLIEAYLKNNQLPQASRLLNDFLKSRNANAVDTTLSYEQFFERFRYEKQKEFLGEPENFFDLKRWNTDIKRYNTDDEKQYSMVSKSDYRWTLPIPFNETKNNKVTQNKGWE